MTKSLGTETHSVNTITVGTFEVPRNYCRKGFNLLPEILVDGLSLRDHLGDVGSHESPAFSIPFTRPPLD